MGDVSKTLLNGLYTVFLLLLMIITANSLTNKGADDHLQIDGRPKMQYPVADLHDARNNLIKVAQGFEQIRPNVALPQAMQNNNVASKKFVKKGDFPMHIADTEECSEDFNKYCQKNSKQNNFAVLECLQNANEDLDELSVTCNQYLWNYKLNLTDDSRFREAALHVCKKEVHKFCPEGKTLKGELLSCLVQEVAHVDDTHCRQFLNRMEIIIFSDYRLIRGFYQKCSDTIKKLHCGNVHQDESDKEPTHLQGKTIQCLESKSSNISDRGCKKEILKVAELSADNYQMDRAFYFACKSDTKRFCPDEVAGEGKIYKCLQKHRKEKFMSEKCLEALTIRQKLANKDIKVNKQLTKNCHKEIGDNQCYAKQSSNENLDMSKLIMCLENDGVVLSGECQAELFDIRKSMMEDYKVNPEIVLACYNDIEKECKGLRKQGKTLHCLMGKAMKNNLDDVCKNAVLELLRKVKAGDDYRLDPILASSCQRSIGALCKTFAAGNARVLSCLMEHITDAIMDKECASQLYQLQYFIAKDFSLDPQLYKNCKKDTEDICRGIDSANEGFVFSCLHNHLHTFPAISLECSNEVHRVLRQRAASVSLNPAIEENCRPDLGKLCHDNNKELECLQEQYADLEEHCKDVMKNFIQEESEDVRMNKALMKACTPMLKTYCQDSLRKQVDEGDALQCLISHKADAEMDPKCAAGIEHFQIIQLKDFTLSFKFKKACKDDVDSICTSSDKTKNSILTCLSERIRNQALLDQKSSVSEACRAQVKFEMLQRSEDINLDPRLKENCKAELEKYCKTLSSGHGDQLECLRKHQSDLGSQCYTTVFNREKVLIEKPEWDFLITKACQRLIKTVCKFSKDPLLECLQSHIHDTDIEPSCKSAIGERMEEKTSDFRLNPTLKRVCILDMGKFCIAIKNKASTDKKMDMQGEMLDCLKTHLEVNRETRLSPLCEKYVRHHMVEAALNFKLDPSLRKVCGNAAKKHCAESIDKPGDGLVEDCLKELIKEKAVFIEISCRQQIVKTMMEGLADVHVDPLLYKACSLDLKHYCHGVMRGQGQQMACLLEALEDSTVRLQKECDTMLRERKELWEFAAEVAPPETLNELYLQVTQSSSRNHFFMSFLSFIAGILCFGICCGRVSKRIPTGIKNK